MIKRDMVRLLFGIEILFNAANLFFIIFSRQIAGYVDPFAHSIVMMAIVLDGTVIAVGLAMVLNVYKHYKTIDIRKLRRLKW
ncbi:MAG: NADH-quinone oxidoreductase subunit NuoK [Promethearchaeota archaeon]